MKTLQRTVIVACALGLAFAGYSCGPKKQVSRTSADAVTDLSGNWNDTDAKLVSEEMINDCLGRPWLETFIKDQGRNPTVRVRLIKNRSREHIDVNIFTKQIERALLNSGKVDFKAKEDEISQVRAEQDEGASGRVSDESAPSIGNEAGVDFVLIGEINMNIDQAEGIKAKFYQVNMEMQNTTSAKKVWIGEKQIKKVIEQAGTSF